MNVTTRDAEKLFKKLGIEEVASTHHVRGFVVKDGVRVLPVHYSRGHKPMPTPVVHKFRRSLRVNEQELRELIGCSLSKEDYLRALNVRL